MIQAIQLLLSLSILVVLHEFGHYITAKMFGCRVEKFYLFMDWKFALFKKKIGETEFGVGWLPLGGYVKISGMVDESMDTSHGNTPPEPWELRAKPAWQRLIVMLGGIIVNIILAFFIYSMILCSWGENYIPMKSLEDGLSFNPAGEMLGFEDGDKLISIDEEELLEFDNMKILSAILFEGANKIIVNRRGSRVVLIMNPDSINIIINNLSDYTSPLISPNFQWVVGEFLEGSVAKESGLEVGDRVIAINDFETVFYTSAAGDYLKSQAMKDVELTIERGVYGNLEKITIPLAEDGMLGVVPSVKNYQAFRSYTFFSSLPAGWKKTTFMMKSYWSQVKTIFNPTTGGYKHVGGVISIGKMFPSDWDWNWFWQMTALLSIILAIMNLLPIPALDGGHALIAFGEMLTGKKLPVKILEYIQVVGMFILFALIIYANGMDIVRLFNS